MSFFNGGIPLDSEEELKEVKVPETKVETKVETKPDNETPVTKEPTVEDSKPNTAGFIDFLKTSKDPVIKPKAEEKEGDQEPEVDSSTGPDPGKKNEKTEGTTIGKEEAELAAEFAADVSDMIMPRLITMLEKVEDNGQYDLSAKQRKVFKTATTAYLLHLKIKPSPKGQFLMALGAIYGMPLVLALITRLPELLDKLFGKAETNNETRQRDPQDEYEEEEEEPEPEPVRKKPTVKVGSDEAEISRRCLDCGTKNYKLGTGFPKNTKHQMHDKFCSRKCYTSFGNRTGMFGKKKSK